MGNEENISDTSDFTVDHHALTEYYETEIVENPKLIALRKALEQLDEVERDILRLGESRVDTATDTIKDLVHKAITTIEQYHQRQGMLTGVGTGFIDLDKMTSGLHEAK